MLAMKRLPSIAMDKSSDVFMFVATETLLFDTTCANLARRAIL